jgi:hypothetical protein
MKTVACHCFRAFWRGSVGPDGKPHVEIFP